MWWPRFSRSLRALLGRRTPTRARRSPRRNPTRLSLETLEARCVPSTVPNDPLFAKLYGLEITGAPEAWDLTTGSTQVTVAVIDSGVDYTHPDLYLNIWLNQEEIPFAVGPGGLQDTDGDDLITFWDLNATDAQGNPVNGAFVQDHNGTGYIDGGDLLVDSAWANGQDDGGNGFTDDLVGWDFGNDDNDPMDASRHGTHVAGTIGAVGNNGLGVVGVNWKVQLMAVKWHPNNVSPPPPMNAIDAFYYAVDNGARVSNNSYGGTEAQLGFEVIAAGSAAAEYAAARGHLAVASAANESSDNDALPFFPASYAHDNVIAVAATDKHDRLARFSNYGKDSVDLGAPGVNILSTVPGGDYDRFDGTSMAAPHVAGAAALILARHPDLSYTEVRDRILASTDWLADLDGKTVTGGRLNLYAALTATPAGSWTSASTSAGTQASSSSSAAGSGFVAAAWSVQIGSAPNALTNAAGMPQDVHLSAAGNNTEGWRGGGVLVLGHLAQFFGIGQHAVLTADIVAGGLVGIDSPVLPGTYVAPSPELGDRTFEVVSGQTFYLIVDFTVVNSNITDSVVGPIPVGATFQLMYTFDAVEGRSEQPVVAWLDVGTGFVTFLNEGVMMTNLGSS